MSRERSHGTPANGCPTPKKFQNHVSAGVESVQTGEIRCLYYRRQVLRLGIGNSFLDVVFNRPGFDVVEQVRRFLGRPDALNNRSGLADRKSLSAHRDFGPEFEAGSGCFHAQMVLDRGLRVKRVRRVSANKASLEGAPCRCRGYHLLAYHGNWYVLARSRGALGWH